MHRWLVHGVDFTSRPGTRKPITVASGRWRNNAFNLEGLEELSDWESFEHWLRREGPWIAGFDFPFGLPRSAVIALGWPLTWPALVRHCAQLGKAVFRDRLNDHRQGRPVGNKYEHRATDLPARSHSPLKLVNPPVGLMFFEGAPRLLESGVSIPRIHAGDPSRVALEAYPGFVVRHWTRQSYKNDAKAKQTPARRAARRAIVENLTEGRAPFGFRLRASRAMFTSLIADGSGDRLDAVICAMQAGWAMQKKDFGFPDPVDPLEGWITMVER